MSGGFAELARLDATALVQALAARRIGALELLEASIACAEAAKDLNAVVRRELEPARARARAFDERLARGARADGMGLLAGLPMTIKDTFDVEEMPAAAGVASLLGRKAFDAAAVARIRAQGAVIWGKTNTPAMAGDSQTWNPLYGLTCNPWDPARTPGGSSGGAAAALAAGITPLELGSDMSGSLRVPASFCGVFAHKPTHGLVSQRGHVPPAPDTMAEPDLNVVGPMARSARDLRLLLSVIADAPVPARASPAPLPGLKAALWLDEPPFALDPEVRTVIESFAAALAREGAHVERMDHLLDGRALIESFAVLLYSALPGVAPPRWRVPIARLSRAMGAAPLSWGGAVLGARASHAEWLAANEARVRLELAMRKLFDRFDVILAPCAPVPAFPHDRRPTALRRLQLSDGGKVAYASLVEWNALASACGLPATAAPAGRARGGLPVGVQIIGPRGGDSKLLAIAQAIDEQVMGFTPPPDRAAASSRP